MTIRHVLSHISGLREWRLVATFAGTPEGTYILDNQDLLRMASRQRALNFDPGTTYSYTNTGFNIETILIERALNNGKTFQEFTREEIFEPLKMTHTRWRDDFRAVVPNRALAYGFKAERTPCSRIVPTRINTKVLQSGVSPYQERIWESFGTGDPFERR